MGVLSLIFRTLRTRTRTTTHFQVSRNITMSSSVNESPAVAVYCGSAVGTQKAYQLAALSLGKALVASKRPLVYGGGSRGIMGAISAAVLEGGGDVTGIIPYAIIAAGGEGVKENTTEKRVDSVLKETGREKVHTIIVNSMHERKVEMAKRVGGFIGLPGGYGTFEEIMEVITWTQLAIHSKPVIIINVLSFYDPIRTLIRCAINEGFIHPDNERLVLFVDGPVRPPTLDISSPDISSTEEYKDWVKAQESFDWGQAALEKLDEWNADVEKYLKQYPLDWSKRVPSVHVEINGGEELAGI